jgi:3'-phosphoadenosine 5'-phosphosulfate sulfotransferase (PAPS reductase)/FAD synthetase
LFFVLLASFNNIFKPLFRRVGCFCLSLEAAARQKQIPVDTGETQRSERWQGADVGAVSAKMLFGLYFGAKAALRQS